MHELEPLRKHVRSDWTFVKYFALLFEFESLVQSNNIRRGILFYNHENTFRDKHTFRTWKLNFYRLILKKDKIFTDASMNATKVCI